MNAQRLNELYSNIHVAEKSDIESIKQLTVDYPFYHLPYVVLAKYYYDTSHYKFEDMLRQAAMRVKDRRELYYYIHGNATEIESAVDPDVIKYEEPDTVETAAEPVKASLVEAFLGEERIEEEVKPEITHIDQQKEAGEEVSMSAGEIIEEEPDLPVDSVEPLEALAVNEIRTEGKTAGINDFLEDFSSEEDKKPEEFVFEGRHPEPSLESIEMDAEPVGEEINAEFSFSKSFHIEEVTQEEKQDEPESAETVIEEEARAGDTRLNEDLRKNPVYNVEAFVNEGSIDQQEELSPEKDFFAWLQHPHYTREKQEDSKEETSRKDDHKIDLIEKFINVNPQISRPKKEFYNPENMAKKSEIIDLDYVTETLANIYYEQGNLDLAIKAYKKLSLQNPSKQAFFASLIEKIKKEKK